MDKVYHFKSVHTVEATLWTTQDDQILGSSLRGETKIQWRTLGLAIYRLMGDQWVIWPGGVEENGSLCGLQDWSLWH